ncbi:unnamed protein product [Dovyalis caffra]|uniref:Uncharacterized protein n=1 Tax=Dovyalis caffra TaxID=77055 RepID=A0AAV1S8F3_9ROSI|nr:unnamed protein product [Dovyalis caffra]
MGFNSSPGRGRKPQKSTLRKAISRGTREKLRGREWGTCNKDHTPATPIKAPATVALFKPAALGGVVGEPSLGGTDTEGPGATGEGGELAGEEEGDVDGALEGVGAGIDGAGVGALVGAGVGAGGGVVGAAGAGVGGLVGGAVGAAPGA